MKSFFFIIIFLSCFAVCQASSTDSSGEVERKNEKINIPTVKEKENNINYPFKKSPQELEIDRLKQEEKNKRFAVNQSFIMRLRAV